MYLVGGSMHGKEYTCNQMYRLDLNTFNWDLVKTKGESGPVGSLDEHSASIHEQSIVIFGGFIDGTREARVFTFDVATFTWELMEPADPSKPVPSARAGHSGTIHKNDLYIFGGKDDLNEKLNDIWKFNLSTRVWTECATDMENKECVPTIRSGHSAILYGDYIGIFGGIYEVTKELNDFHLFDTKNNRWITLFAEKTEAVSA